MKTQRVEFWAWALIYGGLIGLGAGLALRQVGATWGACVIVLGALAMAVGVILIWARSRMKSAP